MKVILKVVWDRNDPFGNKQYIFKPKKQTAIEKLSRELWEREYNTWWPEPVRELSYFEENYCRVADDYRLTEFFVKDIIEMEV